MGTARASRLANCVSVLPARGPGTRRAGSSGQGPAGTVGQLAGRSRDGHGSRGTWGVVLVARALTAAARAPPARVRPAGARRAGRARGGVFAARDKLPVLAGLPPDRTTVSGLFVSSRGRTGGLVRKVARRRFALACFGPRRRFLGLFLGLHQGMGVVTGAEGGVRQGVANRGLPGQMVVTIAGSGL